KLGVPKTRIAKWETGRTNIDWLEFVDLASTQKRDLRLCFDFVFGIATDPRNFARFMQIWAGSTKTGDLAKLLGINVRIVQRWLSGAQVPKLPDMLRF